MTTTTRRVATYQGTHGTWLVLGVDLNRRVVDIAGAQFLCGVRLCSLRDQYGARIGYCDDPQHACHVSGDVAPLTAEEAHDVHERQPIRWSPEKRAAYSSRSYTSRDQREQSRQSTNSTHAPTAVSAHTHGGAATITSTPTTTWCIDTDWDRLRDALTVGAVFTFTRDLTVTWPARDFRPGVHYIVIRDCTENGLALVRNTATGRQTWLNITGQGPFVRIIGTPSAQDSTDPQ